MTMTTGACFSVIDDDSISVVSTVPSTADSDASSVHSVKGEHI